MRRLLLCATLLALTNCTCDGEPDPDMGGEPDSAVDAGKGDATNDTGRDMADPDDAGGDMGPRAQLGDPVPTDISQWTEGAGAGTARVFASTSPDDLVESPFQNAQVGDWVMENDLIRVVIEQDDRVITSCPWGGHIIAGEAVDGEGGSILGEACLFFNGGSTVRGSTFEVVSEGGEGTAAVLAVTGTMELLDFINFPTMAEDFGLGPFGNLAVGPNRVPPLTATTYYILRPGERHVRAVTGYRNDGDSTEHVVAMYAMPNGGDGFFYNPWNEVGGWGYKSLSVSALGGAPAPFAGYAGPDASYLVVPEPVPGLGVDGLPMGAAYLGLSGLAFLAMGIDDLLPVLLAQPTTLPDVQEIVHLEPGEVAFVNASFLFGSGSVESVVTPAYELLGVETGTVEGRVVDAANQPVAGATVTAVRDRLPLSQARTAADGSYVLAVPAGDYELRARLGNVPGFDAPMVTVVAGESVASGDVMLANPGTLQVAVNSPDGSPIHARVSVICEAEECPARATDAETEVGGDQLPDTWAAVGWALDGNVELDLPPGDYRVVVSRGIEYSVWPQDATTSGGQLVTITAGADTVIDAEIARVVDSAGAIGADFHVHGYASHDSGTPDLDRIRSFVVEGTEVIVSSDHDAVVDWAPAIAELGFGSELTTLVGLEVSTTDIGHFNAFPMTHDPTHRRGGAVDWAGGDGPSMTPQQLFDALREQFDGEQVIQVNHAAGLGLVEGLQANVLTRISTSERERMRMPPGDTDPVTGDTGLWSDDFTAFEVYNGLKLPNMWPLMRWWQTMIGRGFAPTGTAVTDTHRRYGQLGGVPRSFVFLDTPDTPDTVDQAAFVASINAGRVVGTSGPFFVATLTNGGDTVSMGETIDGSSGSVTLDVDIQTPEWITVDTVDVYVNQSAAITETAEVIEDELPPTLSLPIATMQPVEVATGDLTHRRLTAQVSTPIAVTADAYVVVVVRGSSSLYPVAVGDDEVPFAFANPIFIDFDGNGYDNPPF